MKKGISFSYEEKNGIVTRCYQKDGRVIQNGPHPIMRIVYSLNQEIYKHPFLSWENLTYAYVEPDEEELDDYLLHHALQDDIKTSVALYTRELKLIEDTFSKDYLLEINKRDGGYYQVFIVRK